MEKEFKRLEDKIDKIADAVEEQGKAIVKQSETTSKMLFMMTSEKEFGRIGAFEQISLNTAEIKANKEADNLFRQKATIYGTVGGFVGGAVIKYAPILIKMIF